MGPGGPGVSEFKEHQPLLGPLVVIPQPQQPVPEQLRGLFLDLSSPLLRPLVVHRNPGRSLSVGLTDGRKRGRHSSTDGGVNCGRRGTRDGMSQERNVVRREGVLRKRRLDSVDEGERQDPKWLPRECDQRNPSFPCYSQPRTLPSNTRLEPGR